MVRGFERELMTSRDRGITYAVFVGKRNISESELAYPSGDASVRIAPVVSGSKAGGLFQTIAGVALAAVGGVTAFLGNRLNIDSNGLRGFDANGTLRYRLGFY